MLEKNKRIFGNIRILDILYWFRQIYKQANIANKISPQFLAINKLFTRWNIPIKRPWFIC